MVFFTNSKCKICSYFAPCKKCLKNSSPEQLNFVKKTIITKILKFKVMIKIFKEKQNSTFDGLLAKNFWQLLLEIKNLQTILNPLYNHQFNICNDLCEVKTEYYFEESPLFNIIKCIRSVTNLRSLIIPVLLYKPSLLRESIDLLIHTIFIDSMYITSIPIEYKDYFYDKNILDKKKIESLPFNYYLITKHVFK